MASGEVKFSVVTEREPSTVTCSSTFTVEDLCILLCKKYKIPPLTRTLFGLRVRGTDYFLKDNCLVLSNSRDYELRIRFKVPVLSHLKTLDETTYDYYFQQARNDVNENRIPEIRYPEHKKELLGLGITDMYRAILEENLHLDEVVKNYKRYIPKVILRRHGPFPKKYAHDYLRKIILNKAAHHDVYFVKSQYLQQLYLLAPNYLAEEYKDVSLKTGQESVPVTVQVAPFHHQEPGLRLYNKVKCEWAHICSIEEIVYLTRNSNLTLEISRRGTPLFLKFKNEEQLSSFISVCDGYYRLMVKWTFNLSKDDETPSLKELHRIKCHGPVGGAFSYRKLEEKRGKKHGCFVLRQCQDDYNVCYLDVCTDNGTTETYKLEFKGHCYLFNYEEYPSIERLLSCHQNPAGRIYLHECIPPSEYDKSQLLLCGEPQKKGVRIDAAELQEILRDNRSPRCLSTRDILLYTGSEKVGIGGITATHKALWKLDETRKLEVAFKTLLRDKANDYLKDFIELASKWACVQSNSIVRLYGVTLSSPTALVLEYLPLGPFDVYLRENKERIKPIHLKKVAAYLARALWDLSEAGVVHGRIRCRRLLLAAVDDERILVKLTGPSLHPYTDADVHWIPVEFFSDMSLCKRSVAGDIWAFATTLWEIFSFGQSPTETNPVLTAKSYIGGSRLHRPAACPAEVWALAALCWRQDPHLRARPQEIMRDMNHMLHSEYTPSYETVQEIPLDHQQGATVPSDRLTELSDVSSNKSLISDSNSSMNGTVTDSDNLDNHSSNSMENMFAFDGPLLSGGVAGGMAGGGASWRDSLPRPPSPLDAAPSEPRLMESIESQGITYLVYMNQKIGSGNYGDVYKGVMERDVSESARRDVAVKRLRRRGAARSVLDDFHNELKVMKSLQHVNIVEILGYSLGQSDVLIVMEYIEEGSLSYYLKYQGDKLRTAHLLKYALDIATGMDHISAKNVVHRDLAARNILVVNRHHVKISDFGLARVIPKEETAYRVKTSRHLPINWYAPESAAEPWEFSSKSDVWSYGVTAWELFCRARQEVPKFDRDRPRERANCFPIPDGCPSGIYRHLMQECWREAPSERPAFIDLVHLCKRFIQEYK